MSSAAATASSRRASRPTSGWWSRRSGSRRRARPSQPLRCPATPLTIVAAKDGLITFAGPACEAPSYEAAERIDCEGRWITPGLIDCHTHLVYGGNRAHEFELRLAGATYEEIARAGGGIASTVEATRRAREEQLIELKRLADEPPSGRAKPKERR